MREIKVEQKLRPFRVPNYVIVETAPRPRQEGFVEGPKYSLGELSDDVLQQLCDQFREDVMRRADEQRQNTTVFNSDGQPGNGLVGSYYIEMEQTYNEREKEKG